MRLKHCQTNFILIDIQLGNWNCRLTRKSSIQIFKGWIEKVCFFTRKSKSRFIHQSLNQFIRFVRQLFRTKTRQTDARETPAKQPMDICIESNAQKRNAIINGLLTQYTTNARRRTLEVIQLNAAHYIVSFLNRKRCRPNNPN